MQERCVLKCLKCCQGEVSGDRALNCICVPYQVEMQAILLRRVTRIRVMKRGTGGLKVLDLSKLIGVLDVNLPALSV